MSQEFNYANKKLKEFDSEYFKTESFSKRKWRRQERTVQVLRDARGNRCRRCSTRERFFRNKSNLEFAHVKPTGVWGMGRGGTRRYYDIKKNPDCYELLCGKCHRIFDARGGYKVIKGLLLIEFLNEGGKDAAKAS